MPAPVAVVVGQRFERPEIVAENESPIAADGTVKVEIDTALAKAVHGDTDHKYQVTAEVTDDSRRDDCRAGNGAGWRASRLRRMRGWIRLLPDRPAIDYNFAAQTLDNKPIKGPGTLKLLKVTYRDNKPVETEVQHWDLNTDDQGHARQQMKADQPGQYRLSYTVSDMPWACDRRRICVRCSREGI